MKITKNQLRRIIKEEMDSMIMEAPPPASMPLDWEQSKTDVQDASQSLSNAIQCARDVVDKRAAYSTYTDADAIDAQKITLLGAQAQEALDTLENALNKITGVGDTMTSSGTLTTDPWPVLSAQER